MECMRTSFESFLFKLVIQIAGKNNKSEVTKLNVILVMMFALKEKIASNNKNDVTSVITNPTLFAALNNAMVLTFETIMMLDVKAKAYMPIPYMMTIGIRATATDGSKNQNDPTPKVNNAGKMNIRSVASRLKSSANDHANKTIETREIILMERSLFKES